jgi:hypothetical protein
MDATCGKRTVNHRGDPDRVKAHALDIVELRLEPLEGAAAVAAQVVAAPVVVGALGDAVRHGKVDAAALPRLGVGGEDAGELQEPGEEEA